MSPIPPAGRSVMLPSLLTSPRLARAIDLSLAALILLNVAAAIFETVDAVRERLGPVLAGFELFSVAVFTVEYVLRVRLAPQHPSGLYRDPVRGRLRFVLTPMALVDLVAILPFYLGFLVRIDLRFLRALRLVRIFKLTRQSAAMTILLDVLRQEARSFGAALSILVVILILASSGIYLVEHQAQPEAFGSIPAAMWWAVATLTTVGYGDVTPVTVGGKLFGALVTVVGIGMVALPAGILSSAFSDHLRRRREVAQGTGSAAVTEAGGAGEAGGRATQPARGPSACPHCGGLLG